MERDGYRQQEPLTQSIRKFPKNAVVEEFKIDPLLDLAPILN